MAIADKIRAREAKLEKAYQECRTLYQKLESVQRSGNRTANAYGAIRLMMANMSDLIDDSFNVPIKKRVQRDIKKAMLDIAGIGYDEL